MPRCQWKSGPGEVLGASILTVLQPSVFWEAVKAEEYSEGCEKNTDNIWQTMDNLPIKWEHHEQVEEATAAVDTGDKCRDR